MTIALIALSSIIAIVLFSYFFTYIKNFKLAGYILSTSVFFLLGIFFSLLLYKYLPDSFHILITTIFAYIAAIAGHIFMIFTAKPVFKVLGRFFYLLVAAIWIQLYFSTFYLYHIQIWMTISSAIIYLLVFAAVEILLPKKNFLINFWVIVFCAAFMFLDYCGFITMCMSKSLYSILLFAGCTLLLITLVYYIFEFGGRFVKHTEPAKLILLLLSQALISSAGVLMIH